MSHPGRAASSETLSQHDIDSLLRRDTPPASRGAIASDDVQVYDFRRPSRVSKERLRALEAMYDRLVKSLEGWLVGRVRGQVELRLMSVEPSSFDEFTLSLPNPCASFLMDIADSGGQQAVLDVGSEFAFFLVDRLFGGGGQPSTPDRSLTLIERMAVRGVAERVSTLLAEVWQDHVPLDLTLSGFETIPEILQAANREDPVLVANVEVRAGGTSSMLLICLPFAALDKFFGGSLERRVNNVAGSAREREASLALTESSVRASRVAISARLPEFLLSLRDIAALAPGAVIPTGIARDAPLTVRVNGQPRFAAAAGRVGQKLALQLTRPIDADAESGDPDSAIPFQSDSPLS
jgi:flagellar motor switch protein FliM